MPTQQISQAQEMRLSYENARKELKAKHDQEFEELHARELEKAIRLVELRYESFSWRGSVAYRDACPTGGSCLFKGLDYCHTINMDNAGFSFSSDKHKRIRLRDLPTKTVRLMIDLIAFMDSKK